MSAVCALTAHDAAGEGAGAPAVPNRVFTSERAANHFSLRSSHSQPFLLNNTYNPAEKLSPMPVEAITPHVSPEPGYGTFMP